MKLSPLGQSSEKPVSAVKATAMSKADSLAFHEIFSDIRSIAEEMEAVKTHLRKGL